MHTTASLRSACAPVIDPFRKDANSCPSFIRLDHGWRFRRLDEALPAIGVKVSLPHCPFTPDLDGRNHWFGECEYRREFTIPLEAAGAHWRLFIGAAMHTATVFVDDREIGCHVGGYLPFEVELPAVFQDALVHTLIVRVDNRYDPDVPPGKPFDELDFCWYGGLYRNAELRRYPPVHITDPVAAGEVGGGGVFVRTLAASDSSATLAVRTHVRNRGPAARDLRLHIELANDGRIAASFAQAIPDLEAESATHVNVQLEVFSPRLWAPGSPALYELRVSILAADGTALDVRSERIGIRRIQLSRTGGFVINGRRMRLRGTNRHQEFPRVGYAAPRAAQFRDARRIKDAGFDYVRLSHCPQSSDFLSACDELGIIVMNCIPGWQYLGGERFRAACFEAAREMIRRDRNHPCVVLWELSLNETVMDEPFMTTLHAIGHEEYPGDQMFTCGWIDRYDVYLRSRQHGQIHTWKNGDKALIVAEYGDWEFYATNDGFDQKTGAGVLPRWSNARKFRADGERGLRQQAENHTAALNDTLASVAVLDGHWSMFDYARGYDPVRAGCGVMDVFRLPKFSYHFYRSQRGADEDGEQWTGGPMAFIASHWLPTSSLRVPVFSNCETVELRLNGELIDRAERQRTAATQHLPHPPFVFDLPRFVPGVLEATCFIAGHACCTHRVATPGPAAGLTLQLDDLALQPAAGEPDLLFVHAEVRDAHGTLCVLDTSDVEFTLKGEAALLGPTVLSAEAGVASTVVQVPGDSSGFLIRARTRSEPHLEAFREVTREADAQPPRIAMTPNP